jgi:hypothetical protein
VPGSGEPRRLLRHGAPHGGVSDGLQPAAGVRVGEDERPHPPPVERAVRREHVRAERARDLGEGGGPPRDRRACEGVGVHDRHAAGAQRLRERALAARDPAGEPDDAHRHRS